MAHWQVERHDLGMDADGNHRWQETIVTPEEPLDHVGASVGIPSTLKKRDRLGDRGIVRSHLFFGDPVNLKAFVEATMECVY